MFKLILFALFLAGANSALLSDAALNAQTRRPPRAEPQRSRPREPDRSTVYYPNCDAARAAGAAPIHRGQPGYRPPLDRDDDGIACEPWRGRR
jgi:hypothetical protein